MLSVTLTFRLSVADANRLVKRAEHLEMTVEDILRNWVSEYVKYEPIVPPCQAYYDEDGKEPEPAPWDTTDWDDSEGPVP